MNRNTLIPFLVIVLAILEIYCYQALKTALPEEGVTRKIVASIYWFLTIATFASLIAFLFFGADHLSNIAKGFIFSFVFGNLLSKFLIALFLLVDDLQRGIRWAFNKLSNLSNIKSDEPVIDLSRAEFLSQAGMVAAAVPLVAMGYGIISGAHDYTIRRVTLKLPNLPSSFDGLKIVQISDVHSGSFFNKTAVQGGVDMLLKEKADVVFFTGDLVNNMASEMKEYFEIFKKIKAPLGVYSTLGNHDYGDYHSWNSQEEKRNNLSSLVDIHKLMGWDILLNENRYLRQGGDSIAILGIENWGAGKRWPKYGKLAQAYKGTEEAPVKILLSHDPSHWDAQVRTEYPSIDLMFAGHTHGFQFGIEAFGIKWSPVQYVYKQWAGLYQQENQYLYVNRGFGYIGFPGRIGMPPEITVFNLKKG